jgi:hypothetical protein
VFIETLAVALEAALEFNRQDTFYAAGKGSIKGKIAV